MAAVIAASQLMTISKTSLVCPICNGRYKEPKLLQCLHSFCQECLAKKFKPHRGSVTLFGGFASDGSIECPICQKGTVVPNKYVANLKTNFHLVGRIEDAQVQEKVLQNKTQGKHMVCEACDQKSRADKQKVAVSKCVDCCIFLCESCQTVHCRIPVCSQHTVAKLDDLMAGQKAQPVKKQQGRAKCSKHPGCQEQSGLYCETCSELVCKDCAVLKLLGKIRGGYRSAESCHGNHQFSQVESAASKKRSAVKKTVLQLQRQRLAEFKSVAQSMGTKVSEFDNHTFQLEQQVKKFADKVRVDIDTEEARLLQEIAKLRQDQAKIQKNGRADLNTAIDNMIDATEAAQEILDNSEDDGFLMLCPLIEKGLESHMSSRQSDIFRGLPNWRFDENSSIKLGTLRDSSGYGFAQGLGVQKSSTPFVGITAKAEPSELPQPDDEEDLVYKQKAHIYHFVRHHGIWEERGIGHVKVFRHKVIGALRLVMQLQQESKLIANHSIASPNVKLNPLPSSDRSWVWSATDYSEEAASYGQQFAVKFKTTELANEFKQQLEKLQAARKVEEENQMWQTLVHPGVWNITTKEEDEELMYTQEVSFTKFAMHQGFWKKRENGIGDIKLLRHKENRTLRMIVKNKKDSKICADLSITIVRKINFKSSDELVCQFNDFSLTLLCKYLSVKFKSLELGKEFKQRVEQLQAARKVEEEEEMKRSAAAFAKMIEKPFTFSSSQSADVTAPSKTASSQDPTNSGPLLLPMLMEKKDSSKAGLASTPPVLVTSTSTKPSTVAPSASSFMPKDLGTTQSQGLLFDGKVPVSGPGFNTGKQQAPAAPNPTSATVSVTPSFTFKASQPPSTGFALAKPLPVTLATASVKTTSQSPFAGFNFGTIKTSASPPKTFAFYSGSPSAVTSKVFRFQSFATSPKNLQKANVVDDNDDGDNDDGDNDAVVFVSEKIPTPDQQARAEALLLPPTFFLYEDEPPCPGCRGCEPADEDIAARETKQQPSSIFRDSRGTSTPSFANIRSEKQGSFAQASTKGVSFPQAGAPVFGMAVTEETGVGEKTHEPNPLYYPIVSLPELMAVKTGEEDEEIMYKQRARLYRFAKDLGVWKERGAGDVKLLRHKQSGALRLIMRREQVLKLCANHRITTDMKLDPLQSSDQAWVWHAIDYSEDEPAHEQLAMKFKTKELAHEFKRRLEELQEARREEEKKAAAAAVEETQEDRKETRGDEDKEGSDKPDQEAASEDVSARFKSRVGHWQCDTCMLKNTKDVAACAACMMPKLKAPPQTGNLSTAAGNEQFGGSGSFKFGGSDSATTVALKFGAPQSNSTLTTAKAGSTQAATSGTFNFGGGPKMGFTFGTKELTPPKACSAADTATALTSKAIQLTPIKLSSDVFVCGAKAKEETPKAFSFTDIAEGSSFSFRLNISKIPEVSSEKSPAKPKSPSLIKSPGFNKDFYKDDKGDHIHFEPVVELTEYDQVITGEEGETIKFVHRAKLYRFDKETCQWKERGLGDIKLFYNPSNHKYRIVMRREQVLKVCANHFVTPELDLKSNARSTKSWVWMAMDASEDEPQIEQLAVRFKTEETALEFKKAVDAAKEDIKTQGKDKTKEEDTKDAVEAGRDQEKIGGQSTKKIGGNIQDDSNRLKITGKHETEGSVNDSDDEEYEDAEDDNGDDNEQVQCEDEQIEDDEQVEEETNRVEAEDDKEQEQSTEADDSDLPIVKSVSELLCSRANDISQQPKAEVPTPTLTIESMSKEEDATGGGSK